MKYFNFPFVGDDYRDDDSPPPPPPTSFPSLPLSFTLPKPVPIILPKPVPTSRPPVETSLPSTLAPQPSNTRYSVTCFKFIKYKNETKISLEIVLVEFDHMGVCT